MLRHALLIAGLLSLAGAPLLPQIADPVVPIGYALPTGGVVAPGQVLRIFVQGVGASLTAPVFATTLPLPNTLADISILLLESHGRGADDHFLSVPVPMLAVVPVSTCTGTPFNVLPDNPDQQPHRCGTFVAITVQIPFEVQPTSYGTPDNATDNFAIELIVSERGVSKVSVVMNTFADQIHVIQNEEAPLATAGLGAFAAGLPPLAIDQGLVLHADGTPVRVKPARPGEELVMFALGLGKTTPAAQTGQASPPEATVPVQLRFDFTADARPKLSYAPTQNEFLRFAGLSPGSVGLYQVNFKVPKPPPGTPSCPTQSAASNLTVTISGQASFDGAAVCVAVGQ